MCDTYTYSWFKCAEWMVWSVDGGWNYFPREKRWWNSRLQTWCVHWMGKKFVRLWAQTIRLTWTRNCLSIGKIYKHHAAPPRPKIQHDIQYSTLVFVVLIVAGVYVARHLPFFPSTYKTNVADVHNLVYIFFSFSLNIYTNHFNGIYMQTFTLAPYTCAYWWLYRLTVFM